MNGLFLKGNSACEKNNELEKNGREQKVGGQVKHRRGVLGISESVSRHEKNLKIQLVLQMRDNRTKGPYSLFGV